MTGSSAGMAAPTAVERSARLLGALRIVLFMLWIQTALSVSLSSLALLPLDLLEPVWILRPLPASVWAWLLTPVCLMGFQSAFVLAAAAAALGLRPYRPIAVLAAVLATVDQALKRSYGYGDHPELLLLLTTYVIALAPAADRLSWPRRVLSARPGEYGAAIVFIAVVACFTYVAPAAYRTAHHSLASVSSPTLLYAIVMNSFRSPSDVIGVFFLERPTLASWMQLLVPVATVFELAAPLALLSRTVRLIWVPFAVIFHSLSAFVIGVPFWESMIIVVATLIAVDRIAEVDGA